MQKSAICPLDLLSSIASMRQIAYSKGVLIERAHCDEVLAEWGRTNQGSALTEGVRYHYDIQLPVSKILELISSSMK